MQVARVVVLFSLAASVLVFGSALFAISGLRAEFAHQPLPLAAGMFIGVVFFALPWYGALANAGCRQKAPFAVAFAIVSFFIVAYFSRAVSTAQDAGILLNVLFCFIALWIAGAVTTRLAEARQEP